MQIPLWLFLVSVLFALSWHDMASLVVRRTFPSFITIKPLLPLSISRNIPQFLQHPSPRHQSRPLHKITPATMSSKAFLDTVKARRTYYQLKKESTISDEKIQDIVTQALLHVPSSFNSQSTRIILLVKEEHNKLWDITKSVLKGIVPAEQYSSTEQRLNGFQAGYGTVCLYPHSSQSYHHPTSGFGDLASCMSSHSGTSPLPPLPIPKHKHKLKLTSHSLDPLL